MASRAIWTGQLRLSLVSIPVELHSARRSGARVSFRQIHEPSGKPIHYEKVANGIGPVDAESIVKGYEVDDDRYVLFDDDEIASVKLESKKTLELVQFVDGCEIPPLYFDKPYYLVPTDKLAEDAYRVVRDAMRRTARVGLGQLALRGREYLCAIRPCGDGLLLETLHYADEIKNADPLFSSISDKASDDELLEVATSLIERKTAPFDAKIYEDHYASALRALIESKLGKDKGRKVESEDDRPASRGDNVTDLMAALKKSLEKTGENGKSPGGRSKRRSNKSAGDSDATGKSDQSGKSKPSKSQAAKSKSSNRKRA